jgi:hypothetical protein
MRLLAKQRVYMKIRVKSLRAEVVAGDVSWKGDAFRCVVFATCATLNIAGVAVSASCRNGKLHNSRVWVIVEPIYYLHSRSAVDEAGYNAVL